MADVKPAIRTWHREEFAKGNYGVIPPHVLELLKKEKGMPIEKEEVESDV